MDCRQIGARSDLSPPQDSSPKSLSCGVRWYLHLPAGATVTWWRCWAERDIVVFSFDYFCRWVQRYVPEFEKRWGSPLLGGCIPPWRNG